MQFFVQALIFFLQSVEIVPILRVLAYILIALQFLNCRVSSFEGLLERADFILEVVIFSEHVVELGTEGLHLELGFL